MEQAYTIYAHMHTRTHIHALLEKMSSCNLSNRSPCEQAVVMSHLVQITKAIHEGRDCLSVNVSFLQAISQLFFFLGFFSPSSPYCFALSCSLQCCFSNTHPQVYEYVLSVKDSIIKLTSVTKATGVTTVTTEGELSLYQITPSLCPFACPWESAAIRTISDKIPLTFHSFRKKLVAKSYILPHIQSVCKLIRKQSCSYKQIYCYSCTVQFCTSCFHFRIIFSYGRVIFCRVIMFISCLCIHIDCGSAILASVVLPQVSIYCTIVHLPIHITHTRVCACICAKYIGGCTIMQIIYVYIYIYTHQYILYEGSTL